MILRAENLVKYKGRSVVKGISVEVNQGEIVGLWDLMALENNFILYDCGLVKPNSGNIYLDDLNITDYPMYKRAQQGLDICTRSFCI
jgi:lipopolysaccharide export system ATP-binding protein